MPRPPFLQRPALTRRAFLSAATVLAAPPAWAFGPATPAGDLRFPLRVGYARIGPDGFLHLGSEDQTLWSAMDVRLGGLIGRLVPLQPSSMLGASAPQMDGGASCALAARQMAADAGLDHALLYAVDEGARTEGGWIAQCFAAIRAAGGAGRIAGEAHLLDIAGGAPVESVFADARRRSLLGALAGKPKGATRTLDELALGMELRLQQAAADALAKQHSIADGFMRTSR